MCLSKDAVQCSPPESASHGAKRRARFIDPSRSAIHPLFHSFSLCPSFVVVLAFRRAERFRRLATLVQDRYFRFPLLGALLAFPPACASSRHSSGVPLCAVLPSTHSTVRYITFQRVAPLRVHASPFSLFSLSFSLTHTFCLLYASHASLSSHMRRRRIRRRLFRAGPPSVGPTASRRTVARFKRCARSTFDASSSTLKVSSP